MAPNIYRVTGPRPVLDHEPGTEFEHGFTDAEERDLLDGGRIVIIPRRYQVVGTSRVHETDPGGTFLGAYGVDQEAALLEGGHIERVAAQPPKTKPAPEPPAPAANKSKE